MLIHELNNFMMQEVNFYRQLESLFSVGAPLSSVETYHANPFCPNPIGRIVVFLSLFFGYFRTDYCCWLHLARARARAQAPPRVQATKVVRGRH
jgi:hypothetical protein